MRKKMIKHLSMDLKLLYKSDNYHLSVRDVYASACVCVLGGGGGGC